MSEPSAIHPPIKPDTSAQELIARCVAIVLASTALGGFIVWAGLGGGETYPDSVASIARDSDVRRLLFSEKNREIYVALPPSAAESVAPRAQTVPAGGNTALASLVTLPRPRKKPPRLPAATQQTLNEATPTAPAHHETKLQEPPPAASALDAPYQPEPEPARYASTLDQQVSAHGARDEPKTEEPPAAETTDEASVDGQTPAEATQDDPSWDEPTRDEPTWVEPTWDERASAEPFLDAPPPDEHPEPEERP